MELFPLPLKFKPPSEELQPSAWERREGLLLFMFLDGWIPLWQTGETAV